MTQQLLSYFQIGVTLLLGTAILIQQKGQGLSGAFGGEGGFYRTKRGLEKTLLISTIVLAVLFMGLSISRVVFLPTAPSNVPLQKQESMPPVSELETGPAVSKTEAITIPKTEVTTEPVSNSQSQ